MNSKKWLSTAVVFIGLSLASAWAHAQDVPQVWQLTSDIDLQSLRGKQVAPVNVNVDTAQVLSFKQGGRFRIPVLAQTLDIELLDQKLVGKTRVWQAKNIHSPDLPAIQLFINGGELSAWIPTHNGTYRLEKGQLIKEFKMGGHIPDYKVPYFESLQQLTPLNSLATKSSPSSSERLPTRLQSAIQNQSQAPAI